MGTQAFFEMRDITKYFSRVIANKNVNITIERGEVLALLGENGAGKSTIMKILYGLYRADEGHIFKDGKEQKITSPKDAMNLGISMIQQHFSLIPAHTVTENIILGSVSGKIDYVRKEQEIRDLITKYDFGIDPGQKISELDVGEQQKVEILKALYLKANLLIMDEPTAVLTPQETNRLMNFVREYTKQGNSVIFITHKMKEVMDVADRIVVMRDGTVNGNVRKSETNESELSILMIGKQLSSLEVRNLDQKPGAKPALEVQDLTYRENGVDVLTGLSFTIGKGEILGIAGVSGNGQEELCEVLCGASIPTSGAIRLNDRDITGDSIKDRIRQGIGYVPVDRYKDGMVQDMSLAENIMLRTSYDPKWRKGQFIDQKALLEYTNDLVRRFDVKTPGADEAIGRLSGGNQQKVVIGKWLATQPEVIILDEPTKGIDIGSKAAVHQFMSELVSQGLAVIMVSSELPEVMGMADRIIVMHEGLMVAGYRAGEATAETIVSAASGAGREAA